MTAITLEVSDELAARLEGVRSHLPRLLQRLLGLETFRPPYAPAGTSPHPSAYAEMLDLLTRSPPLQEIVGFKVSAPVQLRLNELLDKNREGELTPEEASELDTFQQVNHLMTLLKLRARKSAGLP